MRLHAMWLCACTTVAPPPRPTPSARPAPVLAETPARAEVVDPVSTPTPAAPPARGETEELHAHAQAKCKVVVTRWPAVVDASDWEAAFELATREVADHLDHDHEGRQALCPKCDIYEPHAYAFPHPNVDSGGMDVRVGGFVVPQADGRVELIPLAFQMRIWDCGPELEAYFIDPGHARLVEAWPRDRGELGGCSFSETRAFDFVVRPDGPLLVERRWKGAPHDERVRLEVSPERLVIRGCGPVSTF